LEEASFPHRGFLIIRRAIIIDNTKDIFVEKFLGNVDIIALLGGSSLISGALNGPWEW